MKLGSQRDLFEIPEDIVYLNCAYMSPQLRRAREVGERAVSRKSRPWELTPEDFFEGAEEVRALFAQLVGGDAGGVAIIPSVSYGISVAAANVPVREGQKIIILENQFPSNVCARRSTSIPPSWPSRTATGPMVPSSTWHASARASAKRGPPWSSTGYSRWGRIPSTSRRSGPIFWSLLRTSGCSAPTVSGSCTSGRSTGRGSP